VDRDRGKRSGFPGRREKRDFLTPPRRCHSVGMIAMPWRGQYAVAIVAAGPQEFKRGPGNPCRACRGCEIRVFSGVDRDSRGALRIIRRTVGAALKYRP